jgi:hypothetical protein
VDDAGDHARQDGALPGRLLQLPHDVLIQLLVRLDLRSLGRVAATCRLLQYGPSSPPTPSPVEDALRLRAELRGRSRTLPVSPHVAIKYLLRLLRQDDMDFHTISAGSARPVSFFVDLRGSLRACGAELEGNHDTQRFLNDDHAAYPGSLGFGSDWGKVADSAYFRKEEPTLVPATAGVRMRSVATGVERSLAVTNDGQVYRWGPISEKERDPPVPTLFDELSHLKVRRVSSRSSHGPALTNDGKLYTWWEHEDALSDDLGCAAGAGYPVPKRGSWKALLCRPKCVEGALAGMRIVSVAAADEFTIVATDTGATFT